MAEVLHDVQAVSAANHTQPDHVVGRVEQVGTMGWRQHKVSVTSRSAVVERDVFSLLIELQVSHLSNTLRERRLTGELVR